MTTSFQPLKVAVIREEFVALTGNPFQAVVLNQFLYWFQRVNDFDQFLQEEQKRKPECQVSLRHGWIYKKAGELAEETLLCVSDVTMRRIITRLVQKGWIDERSNPGRGSDRTLQYRPNLIRIQEDLYRLGYALPGFPLLHFQKPGSSSQGSPSQQQGCNLQSCSFNLQQSSLLYKDTEITAKIKKSANAREEVSDLMLEVWNETLQPSTAVQMTALRSSNLYSVLQQNFRSDLDQWKTFCHELTQSSFLMGKGTRGWKVTLDWILEPNNLQKTLEGKYRDKNIEKDPERLFPPEELLQKAQQSLESVTDPVLRKFSCGLMQQLGASIYLSWFMNISITFTSETLVISFPTRFKKTYVETRYNDKILSVARSLFPASTIQWIDYAVKESCSSVSSSRFDSCSPFYAGVNVELRPEVQPLSLNLPGHFLHRTARVSFSGKENRL